MPLKPIRLPAETDVLDPHAPPGRLDPFTLLRQELPESRYRLVLERFDIPPPLQPAAETLIGMNRKDIFPPSRFLPTPRVADMSHAQHLALQTYGEALARQDFHRWFMILHDAVERFFKPGQPALPQTRESLVHAYDEATARSPLPDFLDSPLLRWVTGRPQRILREGPPLTLARDPGGDVILVATWRRAFVPFRLAPAQEDGSLRILSTNDWQQVSAAPLAAARGLARQAARHFRRAALQPRRIVWTAAYVDYIQGRSHAPSLDRYAVMDAPHQAYLRRRATLYLPQDRDGIRTVARDDRHPCCELARVIETIHPRAPIFPLSRSIGDTNVSQDAYYRYVDDDGDTALCDYYDFVQANRVFVWHHYLNLYVYRLLDDDPQGIDGARRQRLLAAARRDGDAAAIRALEEGPDFRLARLADGDVALESEPVHDDPEQDHPWPYVPASLRLPGEDAADPVFNFNILWPFSEPGMPGRPTRRTATMTFSNPRLFNDLATRLEALPAYALEPDCPYVEQVLAENDEPDNRPTFASLDRFAMLADLRHADTEKPWFTDRHGRVVGNLQAWLAQELASSRTYPDHLAPKDPPALDQDEVDALTGYFLGPLGAGLPALPPALLPLLNPTQLYGRMDAVTAKDAGSVLRAVAEGIPPETAWQDVSLRIRKARLLALADAVGRTPFIHHPRDKGTPVAQLCAHDTLVARLASFGVNTDGVPWEMKDGSWCGDLAVWTVRLFGAFLPHHFVGPLNRRPLVTAPALIGLGNVEADALFRGFLYPRWGVRPNVWGSELYILRMRDTSPPGEWKPSGTVGSLPSLRPAGF